tara:strand:+ start:462 stop:1886 length:1425 start_codon:yes stop_codon:yes gene_type:complete
MTAAFNQMLAQGPTPIKFADPVNQMAQLMQLKNAQQTGVVNQMAIDKGQRQQADQAAYRNMLAQPGFNSTDPATQAQMYGLGFGADAANMAAAKAAQQTEARAAETRTLAAEDRAMDRYKADFPIDGTPDVMRAYNAMAISTDPEVASHMARNPGGLAGANAHFEEVINNPAAFQRFKDSILGESQATRDTHDVAMGRIAKDNAVAAKASQGGGGGEKGSNFQLVQDTNGNWVNVDKRTGLAPSGALVQGRAPGSPAPLSAVQQQKLNNQRIDDRKLIDALKAARHAFEIPIYGLHTEERTDSSGRIIPSANTPGLLSKELNTSGLSNLRSYLPSVRGTDSATAESLLGSIQSQLQGLGRTLMTSAGQGKLGNMAVQEWEKVGQQVGKIDPAGDPKGWKNKLEEILTRVDFLIKSSENQFSELYPDAEPSNAPPLNGGQPAAGGARPPPDAGAKPTAGGGKQVFEGITFERLDE